jgi:hypothetical protein
LFMYKPPPIIRLSAWLVAAAARRFLRVINHL